MREFSLAEESATSHAVMRRWNARNPAIFLFEIVVIFFWVFFLVFLVFLIFDISFFLFFCLFCFSWFSWFSRFSRFSTFSRFLFFTWEHCFLGPCTISFSEIYHIMGLSCFSATSGMGLGLGVGLGSLCGAIL